MSRLLVALARLYQRFLSPLLPPSCRYTPTCSNYFIQAVRSRGPWRGTWMGVLRILRCNPFFAGGYDPVDPEEDADPPPAGLDDDPAGDDSISGRPTAS